MEWTGKEQRAVLHGAMASARGASWLSVLLACDGFASLPSLVLFRKQLCAQRSQL